jgi:hypothetical protein
LHESARYFERWSARYVSRAKKSAGAERYLTPYRALEGAPPKARTEPPRGGGERAPRRRQPMGGGHKPRGHLVAFSSPEIFINFYLLLSTHRVYFANIPVYNNKKVFFWDQELWISRFFTKISPELFKNFSYLSLRRYYEDYKTATKKINS